LVLGAEEAGAAAVRCNDERDMPTGVDASVEISSDRLLAGIVNAGKFWESSACRMRVRKYDPKVIGPRMMRDFHQE
jgi:hypothetical protein